MTTSVETPPTPPAAPPPPAAPADGRTGWAPVPQVNLLPPEVLEARRFQQLRKGLIVVAVVVLLCCAAAVLWAQHDVDSARSDLASTKAQTVVLRQQAAKYAQVPVILSEVDTMKKARAAALGADVSWYQFLADLAINTPVGTQLTAVTITMTGKTEAGTAAAPLSPGGLGTVTVAGNALQYTDIASWLDSVDEVHGLAGSGLQLASKGGSSSSSGSGSSGSSTSSSLLTFTGSAVVVPAALSDRYDQKAE